MTFIWAPPPLSWIFIPNLIYFFQGLASFFSQRSFPHKWSENQIKMQINFVSLVWQLCIILVIVIVLLLAINSLIKLFYCLSCLLTEVKLLQPVAFNGNYQQPKSNLCQSCSCVLEVHYMIQYRFRPDPFSRLRECPLTMGVGLEIWAKFAYLAIPFGKGFGKGGWSLRVEICPQSIFHKSNQNL